MLWEDKVRGEVSTMGTEGGTLAGTASTPGRESEGEKGWDVRGGDSRG